jgi:DNA polymerase III delta prime subunit
MKKALKSVLHSERLLTLNVGFEVTDALLDVYIDIAGGDIRHALNTLQLVWFSSPCHHRSGGSSKEICK